MPPFSHNCHSSLVIGCCREGMCGSLVGFHWRQFRRRVSFLATPFTYSDRSHGEVASRGTHVAKSTQTGVSRRVLHTGHGPSDSTTMAAPRALRSLPLLLGSLLALLACAPSSGARAATLLVSHYSGTLYTLTLTGNSSSSSGSAQLAITSQLRAGGTMPSWLTLDSESRTVYVTDEAGFSGSASLTQLSVSATDGTMRVTGVARTTGGELHSGLYGEKGGFIAVAE